jgi:hypothetical protein
VPGAEATAGRVLHLVGCSAEKLGTRHPAPLIRLSGT